jgi:ribosomal protein S12 methylthiotransferase
VIVNTCGFIDDAVKESLDTIGEALAENGRSSSPAAWAPRRRGGGNLVSRCTHRCWPSPAACDAGGDGRGALPTCPSRTIPSSTWCRPRRSSSRPKHYAYLKISEGCNHRCTFCIIPSMRGDLVSAADRRRAEEARRCSKAA